MWVSWSPREGLTDHHFFSYSRHHFCTGFARSIASGGRSLIVDAKRFSYALAKASPDLNVPDPVANAAPAIEHGPEYMRLLASSKYSNTMPSVANPSKDPADFHASDFRYILEHAATDEEARKLASHFVNGMQNVQAFMSVIGLTSINESYSKKYSLISRMYGV